MIRASPMSLLGIVQALEHRRACQLNNPPQMVLPYYSLCIQLWNCSHPNMVFIAQQSPCSRSSLTFLFNLSISPDGSLLKFAGYRTPFWCLSSTLTPHRSLSFWQILRHQHWWAMTSMIFLHSPCTLSPLLLAASHTPLFCTPHTMATCFSLYCVFSNKTVGGWHASHTKTSEGMVQNWSLPNQEVIYPSSPHETNFPH